ncbi:MAG: M14 family zinc carboxypeptidase, partial [Acidobacteriota bacterium]
MPRLPLIVRGAVARATRFLGAPSRCNGVPNGAFYRLLVLLVVALVAAPSVVAHGPDAPPGLAIDPEDRFAPFDPSATPRVIAVATPVERAGELSGRGLDLWAYLPLEGVGIFLVDSAQELRLRAEGFDVRLDVERTAGLHAARAAAEQAPQGAGIPGFPCYRTVGETYADLSALAASHPEIAAWTSFGSSWQLLNGAPGAGDELFVLQLGRRDTPEVDQAPLVVIAAMHARELSTAEIVARFAETLVAGYGVDPDLTWLLDHRMIHIVAQLNPDGRARAEAGEFWRKNVNSDFCTGGLEGIDLNRNSSFEWGGGSSSECSEIFRGPSAASEPETAAIEAYLATVFEDQKGALSEAAPDDAEGVFLSFHSFGELILYPWEFTNSPLAPNHDALRTLGRKLAADSNYVVCQDCLGTASGTTPDVA